MYICTHMYVQHVFKLFLTLCIGVFTFVMSQVSNAFYPQYLMPSVKQSETHNGVGSHLMGVIRPDDYSACLCNTQ